MVYWILQANPEIYDALAALGDASEIDRWRVARHRNDMTPGDEFALWISGRDGGVYAFGRVTGPVILDSDPDPFWQDQAEGARMDWRVGIEIEEVLARPVLRSDLREDPGFAAAAIIKMPGGGNPFPVTADEWQILQSHRIPDAGHQPRPEHRLKSADDLLRIVRGDQAIADLRTYFNTAAPADPPPYTGARFDTLDGGSRPDTRDRITAADLLAVQCLNVVVPAAISLDLLEGHLGVQVSAFLRYIPANLALGEPETRDHVLPGSPADQAWGLLDAQPGIGWVTAGKLMARKRPHLIPVWDHVVRCAMGYPENAWLWLDELLGQDDRLIEQLDQLHRLTKLPDLVPRLRVLDVIIWMRHRPAHLSGGCPGMD